ncbi:MAG: urease subunit beta [Solirubrobacteraceae bacterium]
MIPGELWLRDQAVALAPGRERRTVTVLNTGDRPVQVGSHFHFAEVNAALAFDRAVADGYRLDVPAGTSIRFEPGLGREVKLVALGGRRVVPGLQIRGGGVDEPDRPGAPTRSTDRGSR